MVLDCETYRTERTLPGRILEGVVSVNCPFFAQARLIEPRTCSE
jgi:hypothetical protein